MLSSVPEQQGVFVSVGVGIWGAVVEEESGEKVTSLDEDTRGGRGQVWTDSGWEPRVFVDRLVQADKQKEESSQVRDGDSNTSPKTPEEGDGHESAKETEVAVTACLPCPPHTQRETEGRSRQCQSRSCVPSELVPK